MIQRVKDLLLKPQPIQRSAEWYLARNTKITASEAASCLPLVEHVCKYYLSDFPDTSKIKFNTEKTLNSYQKKSDYIMQKCNPSVYVDSIYTLHGKKYEDIASRFYKNLKKTDILEFGLLGHDTIDWLAASPDGITPDGKMIEIKCPLTRKIKSTPPIHYWVQMQIQLEVADLEECDFVECEITDIDEKKFLDINEDFIEKGIVLKCKDTGNYTYPPLDLYSINCFLEWSNTFDKDLYIKTFYQIQDYKIITVKRNRDFFTTIKPDLEDTIQVIRNFQNNSLLFEEYKRSMHILENKKYLDKYNSTVCLLD
jgi:putative phage-type endonuclease